MSKYGLTRRAICHMNTADTTTDKKKKSEEKKNTASGNSIGCRAKAFLEVTRTKPHFKCSGMKLST